MDRISDLPPHVIHQIMSHLSTKEVAQTTLLSKQWKDYLRPSFPILKFSHSDFIDIKEEKRGNLLYCWDMDQVFKHYPHKFEESMKGFTEFVDATLDHFCKMKLMMDQFKLIIGTTGNLESWSCLVDKWIELALEHQVKDLTLQIFHCQLYLMPESVFSAKSITNLHLHNCKLNHPYTSNAFKFHSLKELKLVQVNLDELMIQKLTSDSHLLEVIKLIECQGFANCHVPELPRLWDIYISTKEYLISIEIAAPNLHYFHLVSYKLERPFCRFNLASCPNLRNLWLCGKVIADDHTFQDLISKYPLLESLGVLYCDNLRKVSISSQRLEQLEFSECNELEVVHIDTPNLLKFCFECNQVPIASINAPCPWIITLGTGREVDTHWYLKLKEFLGTSNHIKELWMNIFFRERVYETLLARRDVDCCSYSSVNCWRHYLKDVKIQSFECGGIINCDPDQNLDGDALMKAWPMLPQGVVHFALEWCFDGEEA
ncbi:hypothetical protein CCACVL1_28072 [Corchorus capsularis]|uniref:F-box domain-containing protein n=1 Tax=Corchorus capsularis TaxID=210143 RepID=A0A1R3G7P0_COCAP|nr:hypothetical protein CCACVL1_28072 [Corchorus capsularis]